jgi:hypothetical protein
MSRPLRIEYAEAVYHVTSRGNARRPIFIIKKGTSYIPRIKREKEKRDTDNSQCAAS